MNSFERRLEEALVLLEGAWQPVTAQEIYDHYAMVEGGVPLERFSREIGRFYDKLIRMTRKLIEDRVFWGTFADYGVFPERDAFVAAGGSPAFWDRVRAYAGDRVKKEKDWNIPDIQPNPETENKLIWSEEASEWGPPMPMSDAEIENCFAYLSSKPSLIISGKGEWRSLWDEYKKHRNATSLPTKNDAIEAILSSYHHSGSLLEYLSGTDVGLGVPGETAGCLEALDAKAKLPLSDWWDQVSPDVQKKVEGWGAISKRRTELEPSLPAGASEEPHFTLRDSLSRGRPGF